MKILTTTLAAMIAFTGLADAQTTWKTVGDWEIKYRDEERCLPCVQNLPKRRWVHDRAYRWAVCAGREHRPLCKIREKHTVRNL